MDMLVATEWLAGELGASDLVVLDASKHRPTTGRDPLAEYQAGHIPGALLFDHLASIDTASPVPTALPTADQFAALIGSLGISNDTRVVIYDDSATHTSSRVWYMFLMYGAVENVALLDGGLAKWKAEGRPLEAGAVSATPTTFIPRANPGIIRFKADMLANVDSKAEQVLDTRYPQHFTGPEIADVGVEPGHIPGSANVPFAEMYHEDETFKSDEELRAMIDATGLDWSRPVITSCGGGVTAAILAFHLRRFGKTDVAMYDGSWSEWGKDPDMPKELGPRRL